MKARLISVLLVIALLVTVGVFAVQADEPVVEGTQAAGNKIYEAAKQLSFSETNNKAVCPVCGGNEVEWFPIPNATATTYLAGSGGLNKGHYYVPAEGATNSKDYRFESAATYGSVCIHLNNSTLTSTGSYVLNARSNCVLNIMGDGVVSGKGNDGATIRGAGRVNLYGGTYQDGGTTKPTIYVLNGSTNIYNGTVITRGRDADGNVLKKGRNILVAAGTVNMYGGEIKDADTTGTTDWGANVAIKGSAATSAPTFAMYGGTISGGKTTQHGGNIALLGTVSSGTGTHVLRLYGGEITDGEAGMCGGNIFMQVTANPTTVSSENKTEVLSTATGTIISNGKAGRYGGNVYFYSTKTSGVNVLLYSGAMRNGESTGTDSSGQAGNGGNVYISGTMNISFRGMEFSGGVAARNGGNIYVTSSNTTLDIGYSGCSEISGGIARGVGGNIYNAGRIDLQEGEVMHGLAATVAEVEGVATNVVTSDNEGGNIYNEGILVIGITGKADKAPEITGGQAYIGDNIFNVGTLSIKNGTITGPDVDGEHYDATQSHGDPSRNLVVDDGNVNHTGGTIQDGSGKNGGNVYMSGTDSVYTLNGGTIQNGDASSKGNNIYVRGGTLELLSGSVINSTGHDSNGIDASVYFGTLDVVSHKGLFTEGKLTIGGDFTLNSADRFDNIYVNDGVMGITVQEDFTGNVGISLSNNHRPANDYGGFVGEGWSNGDLVGDFKAEGEYTGTITLQNLNLQPEIKPFAVGEGAYKLLITNAKDSNGEWVYAQDNFADVALCGGKVTLTKDETLTLANGATVTAELNGNTATVNVVAEADATATFKGINSTTENYGTAILGAGVTGPEGEKSATWYKDGYYVVALKANENTYNYHKLEMAMQSISLRPSAAGLYYTSVIKTDSALKEMIESAGILLGTAQGTGIETLAKVMKEASAADMADPDAPFTSVAPAKDKLNLNAVTSVLVKNIFTEKIELTDENGVVTEVIKGRENTKQYNAARGAISVVGTPYVAFEDGSVLVCQDVKDCSMQQYLMMADEQLADDAEKLPKVKAFCDSWFVNDFGWTLPHLYPVASEPEATEPEATEAVPDNGGEL